MAEVILLSDYKRPSVNSRAVLEVATTVSLRQSATESATQFVSRIVGAYLAAGKAVQK